MKRIIALALTCASLYACKQTPAPAKMDLLLSDIDSTVKPGDKVITSGGVIATVVSVKEKSIAIRSAETKLEILKSAITEITERAGESAPVES